MYRPADNAHCAVHKRWDALRGAAQALCWCWVLTLGAEAGCDECAAFAPEQPVAPPPPSAARERTAPRGQRLRSPAAFELVATSEGALLAWAPGACADGVVLQRYDADGEAISAPGVIDGCGPLGAGGGEIVQLSAVAEGGRLALAWLVRDASSAHVLGTFGADGAGAFAPTLQLGAAESAVSPGRSGLALAGGDNGRMRVAFRAPPAPCTSGQGQCARVLTGPHPPAEAAAERGADTREVPDPCPELLVGSLWRKGVWYEAFCALEGQEAKPITEVYAIRPEIFYAEALPVLAGCLPLGVARAPRGVLVLGKCDDGLRVHSLSESHRAVISAAVREVRCEAGRPSLEIHNGQGQAITYKLDGPEDRLELWLPLDLAAGVSRAAFTGRQLLVASVRDGLLELKAWRCQGETLVSDGPSMLYNAAPRAHRGSDERLEE